MHLHGSPHQVTKLQAALAAAQEAAAAAPSSAAAAAQLAEVEAARASLARQLAAARSQVGVAGCAADTTEAGYFDMHGIFLLRRPAQGAQLDA